MHRVKGFGDGVDSAVFNSGTMHEVQVVNIQEAAVFDGTIEDRHYDALRAGIPVVNHVYYEQLCGARRLELNPEKIISSDRSAHSVGFGKFVRTTRKGKLDGRLDVALKPFHGPEDALNEASGYLWLGGIAIETFEPVGVFPALNGDHVVGTTRRRHDLMSLDRDEWVIGGRVDNEHKAEITARNERTVMEIAEKMAYIHAHGGFLPDGQIKNWAVTPEGDIGAIDTENFVSLEPGHIDAPSRAWDDMSKLVKSLVLDTRDKDAKMFGVGMFAGLSLPQLRAAIERIIIVPYTAELDQLFADSSDEAKQQHFYELAGGIITRFKSEPAWPEHLSQAHKQHHSTRKTSVG